MTFLSPFQARVSGRREQMPRTRLEALLGLRRPRRETPQGGGYPHTLARAKKASPAAAGYFKSGW